MRQTVRAPKSLRGAVSPPGDKSISHRAAIFNAISDGEAVIENFQRGADCLATLSCLKRLGVPWRWRDDGSLIVTGVGLAGLQEPGSVLDCRNSGTSIRLLAGLLAGQRFFSVLTGDASLRSRPMARVIEPLRLMGARISGRDGDRLAPLAIQGAGLAGIRYDLPVASAQVKSAVLLAGLYADGETVVVEPAPSRDHTERMLQAMGAYVRFGEGPEVHVRRPTRGLAALPLRVPGDISAAAPWIVVGAIHPDAEVRLSGINVNPTRTGLLDALKAMGADITISEERTWGAEPVADIVVRSSRLEGTTISGALVPRAIDELPLLALAACHAEGETVIKDAAELRVKESDRVALTSAALRAMGASIDDRADGWTIRGPTPLKGTSASSYGDHRMAMLLAVAGSVAAGETVIRNAQAVHVSYPWFWHDLDVLARR